MNVKHVSIKTGTMLYACRDITERRQAEQELRELSGQPINAHEQERIRLSRAASTSRPAHRVAVHRADAAPQGAVQRLGEIHDQVAKMASDAADIGDAVHRLSHNLHPSRLEQLGLETSIRTLCRELTEMRQIEIDLQIGDMPDAIEFDTALCLYRMARKRCTTSSSTAARPAS